MLEIDPGATVPIGQFYGHATEVVVPSRSAFEIAAVLTPLQSAVGKRPRLQSNKMADLSAESRQLFSAMLCCVSWQCAVELWGGREELAHGSREVLQVKIEVSSDSLSSCSSIKGTTALAIASVRVNRTIIALATIFVLLSKVLDAISPFKSSTTEVAEARRERTSGIPAWWWGVTAWLLEAGAMLSVSARVPAAGVQTVCCVWAGSMLALGRERGVVNRGVVCMGEGCRGVSGMGGWVEGGGGVVGFHWHWFHCIIKEECG